MAQIDFKANEFKKATVFLSGLHRSAYPSAIRNTLNDLAFDVKNRTLKISVDREFTDRTNFRFFKAFSAVDKARGFNVNSMFAVSGLLSGKNDDIDNLDVYEGKGTSKKRSLIPIDRTRVGGNRNKRRAAKNYHSKIPKFIRSDKSTGSTARQRLIRSGIVAKKGGYVLHERVLFRVTSLQSSIKQRRLKIKFSPVYSYDPGRVDTLKKNKFMSKAGELTAFRVANFFDKNAEFQVNKGLKQARL